jgi:hypothetical protein
MPDPFDNDVMWTPLSENSGRDPRTANLDPYIVAANTGGISQGLDGSNDPDPVPSGRAVD